MDRIPQYDKKQGDVEVKLGSLNPDDAKSKTPKILSGSTATEIIGNLFDKS